MRNLTSKLLSTFALAVLSVAVSAAVARAQDAKIVKIVGTGAAMVTHQGSPAIAATEGMTIALNDDITTAAGVEVYVQAYAGAVATIKQNSHVVIPKRGVQEAEVHLRSGNLVSQLDPALRNRHNYGVRTPKGVAAARGTVFTVTVEGTQYTVVTGAGTVSITAFTPPGAPPAPTVTLGAGGVSLSNVNGGAPTTAAALASNPAATAAVNNAATIAVAAVAVVAANTGGNFGASAATTASAELTTTMATVVHDVPNAVATAAASASAAAPSQAAAVVTAAVQAAATATGGSTASVTALAQTVTQAAA